jgi:hypothetical protein
VSIAPGTDVVSLRRATTDDQRFRADNAMVPEGVVLAAIVAGSPLVRAKTT